MEELVPGLLQSIPDAWGPKCGTDSGGIARSRTGPDEIRLNTATNAAVVMLTPQPRREIALGGDRRMTGLAPVGALEIIPAGADHFARWVTAKENMLFALDDQRLARLACGEFDRERFELHPPRIGLVDSKALALARMAADELQSGDAASELALDGLVTLFSIHLLRTYSSLRIRPDRPLRGGLAPKVWMRVDDYIRANLAERLSIARLAEIAGLSPSHFLRAFRAATGEAPHQYVIGRRLDQAERLIATSELPLAAIAAATGFSSNSHMTATMRRSRGRIPKALRDDRRQGARDAAEDPAGR